MADTREFHQATINGISFSAVMSVDGPYINCRALDGGVAIGTCTSIVEGEAGYDGQRTYSINKYRNQQRILLRDFSEEHVKSLSREFGIPFADSSEDPHEYFKQSPAFVSLVAWSQKHPKLFARNKRCQLYLLWADMVEKQRPSVSVKQRAATSSWSKKE